MNWKRVRTGLVCLFFAVIGLVMFITMDPQTVTCGGQEMQPGDKCEHTRNGRVTSVNSYEEEKRSQETGRWIGLGAAIILTPVGLFILYTGRRKNAPAVNPGNAAQVYQPNAQYPGQPQQYPAQPQQYPGQLPQSGYPYQPGYQPPQQGQYYQQPGHPSQPGYPPQPGHPSQPGYPPQTWYPPQPGRLPYDPPQNPQ